MTDKLIVWLPGMTMVLYALTSLAFVSKRDWPWALVYFAYSLANVGLILASLRK